MNEHTTPARDAGTAESGCSANHLELIARLSIENLRYRAALKRIAKWFDEFPPTGRKWNDGTEMSYSAAFGSNGERDYMRKVASDALSPNANGLLRQAEKEKTT